MAKSSEELLEAAKTWAAADGHIRELERQIGELRRDANRAATRRDNARAALGESVSPTTPRRLLRTPIGYVLVQYVPRPSGDPEINLLEAVGDD